MATTNSLTLPLTMLAALAAGFSDSTLATTAAEAVANTTRPAADQQSDVNRHPQQVLEFFEIRPGMTVLDLFSGGGYYSELLNHIVGERGRVIAHSNQAYENFVGKDMVDARFANNRLPRVQRLVVEANDLELKAESLDGVLMVLTYHDIYYLPDSGWVHIDGPALLEKLLAALKPGATLGIVDHSAQAGAPASTGHSLHRIDPALVKKEMLAAGFEWVGEADFLKNPEDDVTQAVFSGNFRGQTDRFVQRYIKPH